MNSTLKSPLTNSLNNSTYLKIVKSSNLKTKSVKKIYINTLVPNFSYTNSSKTLIKLEKCVLL